MLIVFTNFCFLVDVKIKIKTLTCSFEITVLILDILPVTRPTDPKAAILTLKMLSGSRSCAFSPAANERSALENIDLSQRTDSEEGFRSK
jgi:hypothetical protein